MATTTYHISFPADWAQEVEKEMQEEHYTPSEYFKELYRRARRGRRFEKELAESEEDFKKDRVTRANSLKDFIE